MLIPGALSINVDLYVFLCSLPPCHVTHALLPSVAEEFSQDLTAFAADLDCWIRGLSVDHWLFVHATVIEADPAQI